jgi:hypothetical protein
MKQGNEARLKKKKKAYSKEYTRVCNIQTWQTKSLQKKKTGPHVTEKKTASSAVHIKKKAITTIWAQ